MSVQIRSEMTGSVWKILVVAGQRVEEGDTVVLIEAMKMEIPIIAMDAGTVVEILVQEGDMIADGDPVIRLDD